MCVCQGGNHFDQYEEGQLELEQASLDKPIESVRLHPSSHTIGPAVRMDMIGPGSNKNNTFYSIHTVRVDASSVFLNTLPPNL